MSKKSWKVVIGMSGIAMIWKGSVPDGYVITNSRLWKHRAKILANRWNIPTPEATIQEAETLLSQEILKML